MRSVVFLLVAAVVACGPSAAQIKTAKSAQYKGDGAAIFKIVLDTTAETYKVADAHQGEDGFVLVTQPQWYSPEGGRQSAGTGDYVQIDYRSVRLELIVELVSMDMGKYAVTVTPRTFQHVSGSPQPRELTPDDPNLPGWIPGRVDSLQLEIHNRLQNYVAQ